MPPKPILRPFKVGDSGSDLSLFIVGPFRIDKTRLRTNFPFQHASLSRYCHATLVCPVCLSAVTRHAVVSAACWHSFMRHLSSWILIYERNESVPYQICMSSFWYMLRLTDATCCKLSSRWVKCGRRRRRVVMTRENKFHRTRCEVTKCCAKGRAIPL